MVSSRAECAVFTRRAGVTCIILRFENVQLHSRHTLETNNNGTRLHPSSILRVRRVRFPDHQPARTQKLALAAERAEPCQPRGSVNRRDESVLFTRCLRGSYLTPVKRACRLKGNERIGPYYGRYGSARMPCRLFSIKFFTFVKLSVSRSVIR